MPIPLFSEREIHKKNQVVATKGFKHVRIKTVKQGQMLGSYSQSILAISQLFLENEVRADTIPTDVQNFSLLTNP